MAGLSSWLPGSRDRPVCQRPCCRGRRPHPAGFPVLERAAPKAALTRRKASRTPRRGKGKA